MDQRDLPSIPLFFDTIKIMQELGVTPHYIHVHHDHSHITLGMYSELILNQKYTAQNMRIIV